MKGENAAQSQGRPILWAIVLFSFMHCRGVPHYTGTLA
jgi:hypothetical protein